MLNLYSNLLSSAYSMGDYKAALTFARKGIETGRESKNYELTGDLYYNNALTLAALGYEKDAEHSYLKSLGGEAKKVMLRAVLLQQKLLW